MKYIELSYLINLQLIHSTEKYYCVGEIRN